MHEKSREPSAFWEPSEQRCDISIYHGTHLILSHLEAYQNNGQKSLQN